MRNSKPTCVQLFQSDHTFRVCVFCSPCRLHCHRRHCHCCPHHHPHHHHHRRRCRRFCRRRCCFLRFCQLQCRLCWLQNHHLRHQHRHLHRHHHCFLHLHHRHCLFVLCCHNDRLSVVHRLSFFNLIFFLFLFLVITNARCACHGCKTFPINGEGVVTERMFLATQLRFNNENDL